MSSFWRCDIPVFGVILIRAQLYYEKLSKENQKKKQDSPKAPAVQFCFSIVLMKGDPKAINLYFL